MVLAAVRFDLQIQWYWFDEMILFIKGCKMATGIKIIANIQLEMAHSSSTIVGQKYAQF